MTSTTIIDTRIKRSPLVLQPAHRSPGLKTFVGQAIAGAVLSHFVVYLIPCLWVDRDGVGFWIFALPFFLFLSLFGGVPAGFIIWACTRSGARPLHRASRCLIALLVLLPGWLYVCSIAFAATGTVQLWMLAWLLVSAITIGLLTHSRLRLGRELVRGGEAIKRLSRVLAGLSGVLLRLTVVLLFMETLVAAIRLYYLDGLPHNQLIWATLLCGHFAASLFVVFAKTDVELLAVRSAVAMVPLFLALFIFRELSEPLRYVAGGYLALWALFLVTRWREIDRAFAFLNEEIHYYLID
jgi:hypothetical protein